MTNNIIGLILSFSYVFFVIGISTILQKIKLLGDEGSRKLIHIGVSNCWIIMMVYFDNIWLACIPPLAFIFLNYVSYRFDLIKSMERSEKGSLGTIYYPISLLILVLVTFWLNMTYIGAVGILILGYGDGLAGLIGKKFGGKKLFGNKTVIGSTSMFIASFFVSFIILSIFTPSIMLTGSLLIAIFATLIELFTPRDFDNITVPIGSAALYYLLITIGSTVTFGLLIAAVLNIVIAFAAYKKHALNISGAIAAIFIGICVYVFANPLVWLTLMIFFTSSSLISLYKKERKVKLSNEYEKTKRNYKQVLANGLLSAVFSVLYFITESDVMLFVAVTSIAASCADTWGSELGALAKGKTISIITMKPVKKGESGGISLFGTNMSLVGSFLIAASYAISLLLQPEYPMAKILLITFGVTTIGFLGSLIDSFIGATVQEKFMDSKTGLVTEFRGSKSNPNKKVGGVSFINNDVVNFSSNLISTVIALMFFAAY